MTTATDLPAGAPADNRLRNTLICLLFGATLALLALEIKEFVRVRTQPVFVIEVEDGLKVVVDVPAHLVVPAAAIPTRT